MSVSCLGLRVLDSRLGVRGLTLGWSVTRTAALGRRVARTVQGEGLGVAKDGGRPCPRSFLLARGLLRLPTTATKVSTTATKAKTTATNPCGAGYKCVGFRVRGFGSESVAFFATSHSPAPSVDTIATSPCDARCSNLGFRVKGSGFRV